MRRQQHEQTLAYRRSLDDFYSTPAPITEALLKVESFEGTVWEPACGRGDISEVLIKHGLQVYSSDLRDRGYGEPFVDFRTTWRTVDNIITNPPYVDFRDLAFAVRALAMARRKVALFLSSSFLDSHRRVHFLRTSPLKAIYVFTYPVWTLREGFVGKPASHVRYCWYVWERNWTQEPVVRFLVR